MEAPLLVPVEELADGDGIGHPGVMITEVRGEKVDESLADMHSDRGDRNRQRLEPGADQRQRRRDGIVIY